VEFCVIYLMYSISKVVAQVTEYKEAIQHGSTSDCAIASDVTPLLTSGAARGCDLFCCVAASTNLTTDHHL